MTWSGPGRWPMYSSHRNSTRQMILYPTDIGHLCHGTMECVAGSSLLVTCAGSPLRAFRESWQHNHCNCSKHTHRDHGAPFTRISLQDQQHYIHRTCRQPYEHPSGLRLYQVRTRFCQQSISSRGSPPPTSDRVHSGDKNRDKDHRSNCGSY